MEHKPFILVCDDTRAIRESLVVILHHAGYRAEAVESALDCVALARKDHPDMIIMDIMMPGMDGATASGLMKDVPEIEGVPVVLLSAMPEAQVKIRAEDAGAAGYLLKPYRKSVLLECVERVISGKLVA
ncbi:MAG: response regulator [Planctomycetes bacterium]|nr:response regulator [Planctomycetota bacterium]